MSDEWIIEVLTDLKVFAQMNDLGALSAQLDRTMDVAELELAAAAKNKPDDVVRSVPQYQGKYL